MFKRVPVETRREGWKIFRLDPDFRRDDRKGSGMTGKEVG